MFDRSVGDFCAFKGKRAQSYDIMYVFEFTSIKYRNYTLNFNAEKN